MTEKSTLMAFRRVSCRQASQNSCGSMSRKSSFSRFRNPAAFVAKPWLRAAGLRAQSRISYSMRCVRLIMEGEYSDVPDVPRRAVDLRSERFLLGTSLCKRLLPRGKYDPAFFRIRTIPNVSEGFERAQSFVV